MPVNQLEKQQREHFGKYAGSPSIQQLNLYFHLDDVDRAIIDTMKSPSTKLGFAVQLGTVKFLGTFLANSHEIPKEAIHYLAAQLALSPDDFQLYNRQATQVQHTKLIKDYYNYQSFSDGTIEKHLIIWLTQRAMYTTENNKMLFDMLLKKCLDEKILLPGVSTFERFIARIVDSAENKLYGNLVKIPSKSETKKLLDLLDRIEKPVNGATIKMDILRSPLVEESQKEIARGFKRLAEFNSFHPECWDLTLIPEGKLKLLADYTFKAKANLIRRMPEPKKIAHLLAFIYEYQKKATDEQLLAISKYFSTTFSRAKNKERDDRMRTLKDLDKAALTLTQIVEVLFDESITPEDIRKVVFKEFPEAEVTHAVSQVKQLVRNEQEPIAIDELYKSYRKFKKFIPDILATLEFEANQYGNNTLTIWQLIKQRFPNPITFKQFDSIETCFPKKWRYYIKAHPQLTNQCSLIAGIELLVQGLKKHDIFITHSEKYSDPMKCLIDSDIWEQQRDILINQLELPNIGSEAVKVLTADLAVSFEEAQTNWNTAKMARIEEKQGKMKIIISKIRKKREVTAEKSFKYRVKELMPKIDLSDLLLEVNQRLSLTNHFNHTGEKETRMKHLDISVMAVLLAEACNIGFSPVSKENAESLKYDRLVYVDHQYIRIDTLTAANNTIIKAHKKLQLSLAWGDGQMASADGIRYATPQRSLYSASNPKYFGRGRGITFYNFVSDHYIGFQGMVVSGTLRDSLYLLEGFLNQPSNLNPTQIMTDTAGYSDLVFGLFGLLGFQFSPRIANNRGTKLWRIQKEANYGLLNDVSNNQINTTLIQEHWEDILRAAGSLKSGKVNATELIKALQRDGQPTPLGKAITEYGKVYKTKHQLRYISDEVYAHQILEQLNKGEARHALCRNIFYGRKGKLYQTYLDGMEEQLTALSLVTNAVIYWNTLYLEKVLAQMKQEGYNCSENLIGKLSPLLFEHITFVGKYTFQYHPGLKDGSLRPLHLQEIT